MIFHTIHEGETMPDNNAVRLLKSSDGVTITIAYTIAGVPIPAITAHQQYIYCGEFRDFKDKIKALPTGESCWFIFPRRVRIDRIGKSDSWKVRRRA